MYELELERVTSEIKRRGARRVLLQLPDGMRTFAFQIAEYIRNAGPTEVIISGDSCYGACDLASRQARELGADLLIHYGHTCFITEPGVPVMYVEVMIPIDVGKTVEAILASTSGWGTIGLTSTVQHTAQLGEIVKALAVKRVKALVGEGAGITPVGGQVLGCSYSAATRLQENVDGYIFIGGGKFHPLGLALTTGKQVVVVDPYNSHVSKLDERELMQLAKRRMAIITAARDAKTIGVLVSSKPGQLALVNALVIVEKLGDREIRAFLIYLDEVSADKLNNFTEPEAFIETACPRIAIDGVAGVERPILTTTEARVLLGEKSWEETWGRSYLS
jgi:2-(3-amino-3-carboxypropyl)histidine synthase